MAAILHLYTRALSDRVAYLYFKKYLGTQRSTKGITFASLTLVMNLSLPILCPFMGATGAIWTPRRIQLMAGEPSAAERFSEPSNGTRQKTCCEDDKLQLLALRSELQSQTIYPKAPKKKLTSRTPKSSSLTLKCPQSQT